MTAHEIDSRIVARLDDLIAGLPEGVQADARLVVGSWGTMRFANSRIHQPHLERTSTLSFRVLEDGRLATATTDDLSLDGIRAIARSARSLARLAPPERRFPGFPSGGSSPSRPTSFSSTTADLGPEGQVRMAERAIETAREFRPQSRVSGVLNVGHQLLVVRNSSGLARATRHSLAHSSVLVEQPADQPTASGWSEGAHWDAARLRTAMIGQEAAALVADSPPQSVKAGTYRVLLSGSAFQELLAFLGWLGFGGQAAQEGWSCLRSKRGRRIAPSDLSVTDDGRSVDSIPTAHDFEGHPKRQTPLIVDGIAGGTVTDLLTAGRLKARATGHALPPESPDGDVGPIPCHQVVRRGDASWEELVKATGSGILVTRFHYVRVVHPGRAMLTGMTRDGTYRIARGEIVGPVRNLRFTESVLSALAGIELIGKARRCYSDDRGLYNVTCPAVVTKRFRFTSATVF